MRTKSYFLVLAILIVSVTLLVGCSRPNVITERVETIDLSLGTTIGNHTYLPLSFNESPNKHVLEILQVLDAFEKAHPELEVTSWTTQHSSGATQGLWIDHKLAPP